MASFRDEPSTWQRLDYQLLQNSPISMYFRAEVLAEDVSWFTEHGYQIDQVDCVRWETEEAGLMALAAALSFPPDFRGRSLDAFNDYLGDVEVPDLGGRVLVLNRYDVPAAAMRSFSAALLDIIATQARRNLLFGRRLLALVQSDDPQLAFEVVGACSVTWNPREWLNKTRGV